MISNYTTESVKFRPFDSLTMQILRHNSGPSQPHGLQEFAELVVTAQAQAATYKRCMHELQQRVSAGQASEAALTQQVWRRSVCKPVACARDATDAFGCVDKAGTLKEKKEITEKENICKCVDYMSFT